MLDEPARAQLSTVRERFGTPTYVYDWRLVRERAAGIDRALGPEVSLSYAVKANPNPKLLSLLGAAIEHFDVSSAGELERLLAAGIAPARVSFTGPGKRDFEIARAVHLGVGHLVCESTADLDRTSRCAARGGGVQPVLLRVNPLALPPKFGAHMGGGASQFGIDEELVPGILSDPARWPGVRIDGFHVFSGSNCLSVESLAQHFSLTVQLFDRLAAGLSGAVQMLVIGSGFGIAYHPGEEPLNLGDVAAAVRPHLQAARQLPRLSGAEWLLEMGRFLVADAGRLLTSVIDVKKSRGRDIAILDAGFNNHLAAAGLMGSLLRRNWPIEAVTADGPLTEYTLVGPLCTSIDTLGTRVPLPSLAPGDLIAIGASGAYGCTASPARFISHPEPREVVILEDGTLHDATDHLRVPSFDQQTIENGPGWAL